MCVIIQTGFLYDVCLFACLFVFVSGLMGAGEEKRK